VVVQPLRRLLMSNRPLAMAILVMALLMKLAVPAGFMPAMSDGKIVVGMCSSTGATTMAITIPGLKHGAPDGGEHPGKAEQPCAFAGLSAPSLAAVDPVLLTFAILFVLALGLRPLLLTAAHAPLYLRPPLRAPPAHR
jgi:hypothetical protein